MNLNVETVAGFFGAIKGSSPSIAKIEARVLSEVKADADARAEGVAAFRKDSGIWVRCSSF